MTDQYRLDKRRVRNSFDRAADTYDDSAILQKNVCDEMLNRLNLVKIQPDKILDAGCGTGYAVSGLRSRFKESMLISLDISMNMLKKTRNQTPKLKRMLGWSKSFEICGDLERIPLIDQGAGLVWSNLALQWCNNLDEAFNEIHRVLEPEGLLMFTTLGPDTLKELRAATDNGHTHVSRFIDMHDIGDAMIRAGFHAPVLDVERYTLTYDNVIDLLRDIKSIGAHNATEGRGRGLEGKGFLSKLQENYERFRLDGKLPATYEVVYGHAWKKNNRVRMDDGSTPIIFHRR